MKREQVINCMFQHWYSKFKNVTIESRVIPLPKSVRDYLLADGLVLPEGADTQPISRIGLEGDSDSDEQDWTSEDRITSSIVPPSFPEFQADVERVIDEFGGSVFPKLDWSSPKDAVWISFGRTLQCSSFYDIILLLKSSDFVTHDLTHSFEQCEPDGEGIAGVDTTNMTFHLVLRQWQHITPDREFRCFVRGNNVLAISQRHQGVHFPSLAQSQQSICSEIKNFFDSSIKGVFPDENFTFDVWLESPGNVILIDFNPFGKVTDGLLFNWEELMSDDLAELPHFRFVSDNSNVEPDPYRFYAVPQDFVHLTTGEDPAKFIDLLHLKIRRSNDSSSDSDDETALKK